MSEIISDKVSDVLEESEISTIKTQVVPFEKAFAQVRKACYAFADLYFHFTKALVDELGEDKAFEITSKAVRNRAIERAERLKALASSRGMENTIETWSEITDIALFGWDKSLGKNHCPYAEAWLARYDEAPWFKRFASAYCNINDPLVTEVFTGYKLSQKITKNVLDGDETCERIYFPYEDKELYYDEEDKND